ncbi:MAG: family 20 glycosylhydrolase [Bacteroidales bacterium]|nr:family 20 glycosylhydrolase [Bacteroidales bacterium]
MKGPKIIPKPVNLKQMKGEFILGEGTRIIAETDELKQSGGFLIDFIKDKYGIQTGLSEKIPGKNYILLSLTDTLKNKEAYILKVKANSIEITGATGAGVFYGIQTLMQILPPGAQELKQLEVPVVDVFDYPQFGYRGQHLDVGRHFFPVDFVKNFLDVMAIHKLNTFHWHLTEDQGWRIEIKKYPNLTKVGAWRDSTLIGLSQQYPWKYETKRYGGFYTQEEIKEIVNYAKERYIKIIPEIEMPGHSLAALASYPELSCTGGPFTVATRWGIFEDVYCAGKEKTFEFLQDVLDEVIGLFPGEYIHIGGDEVPKTRWENCPDCQLRIRREGLKDEEELQSYFIQRIEEYLNSKGKKLIGWDEIIEGGLAERATVMSWRGMAGGITAAKAKHNTIMTPWTPCYFYVNQGKYQEPLAANDYTPLDAVYDFYPVPEELTEEEAEYIMGGQGCAWSEHMVSTDVAEYMVFPRLTALAEVLWTPRSQKNWEDFLVRMDDQYLRLDYYNINYRVDYPSNYGFINRFLEEEVMVELSSIINDCEIRYTTNGSDPDESSNLYTGPIKLNLSSPVTLKSRTIMPNGRKSAVHSGEFVNLKWKEAFPAGSTEDGLRYLYYEGEVISIDEIHGNPDKTGVVDMVKLPNDFGNESFAIEYDGYITVPEQAVYDFVLSSERGKAVLYIDEMNVVDNTADLPLHFQETGKIALKEGTHKFRLKYFASSARGQLRIGCVYNDKGIGEIPASWFTY